MGINIGGLDEDDDEIHDINVTPFIDVILVLLIIFMVAAPLSTVDLPVDLPQSSATPQKEPAKPIYVTIKSDLSVAIGETSVADTALGSEIDAQTDGDKNRRIFLRADKAVPYGDLMRILETLRRRGYLKVSLVALEAVSAGGPP